MISAIAKPVVVIAILSFTIQHAALSQSSLTQDLELYKQAVNAKEYRKAAQFAYDIGRRYREVNELANAIEYSTQALAQAKKSGDQQLIYLAFHQLGTIHTASKKYTKALENFQGALTAARKQNIDLVKDELINVSLNYVYLERYKKSIEPIEEALSIAISSHDVGLQQKCYALLAECYSKQGNAKKSAEYMTQLELLERVQQTEALKAHQINELEQHLATIGKENQVTQAKLSEQNKKLTQSSASLRIVERSLRATTDYLQATTDSLKDIEAVSKNRQMEIDLLQKNKELSEIKIKEQDARIENEALVRNSILAGSLLSIALVSVLFVSNRKTVKANRKINQQNKNIRSSINYAKRIQEAMLPQKEHHPKIFTNSFILFKPRDTVSGDFYWISEIKRKDSQDSDIAFAAVDCTGHGVPGAFMSMIGINALNGLVNKGVSSTNTLLDSLDHEIRTALRQEVSGNNDGMDVAICIYRETERILEFSGAKNPLVYIQDNTLTYIKGDIHSIGGKKNTEDHFRFKKHQITIDKPTVVYLFSDGYRDQFGGPKNQKFLTRKLKKMLFEIHTLSMPEQMNILQTTIEEWKGDKEQTDDILVIGLKLE